MFVLISRLSQLCEFSFTILSPTDPTLTVNTGTDICLVAYPASPDLSLFRLGYLLRPPTAGHPCLEILPLGTPIFCSVPVRDLFLDGRYQ